jgi:hypothetical protein
MKLVIAGSRTVSPTIEDIDAALTGILFEGGIDVTEVICGDAAGADTCGALWARSRSIPLHHEPVTPEDYAQHGRYLGPKMRNRRMAERGDAALIFWDGLSGGSADMACRMLARDKPVRVVPYKARSKR